MSLSQVSGGDWAGIMVRTGPGPEPEVQAETGSAPQLGSGQRLGRALGLGRDRYLVEIEPDFVARLETKPW